MLVQKVIERDEPFVVPWIWADGAKPTTVVIAGGFDPEQVRVLEHAQRDHLIKQGSPLLMMRLGREPVEEPIRIGLVAENDESLDTPG